MIDQLASYLLSSVKNPNLTEKNTMNPILASSLVSAGQSLLTQAISPVEDNASQEANFDKILSSRMFDSAKYMEENGLHSVEDVKKHIQDLKGQLLQSSQFNNTPYSHEDPARIEVLRGSKGFLLQSEKHQAHIPTSSGAHSIAHTIHNLQNWINSQS
jgi:hypothetical protein